MVFLFWILLVLAGVCFLVLMPSLLGLTIYQRYHGARMVTCPQTRGPASVRVDAYHAALTGMASTESLRIAACNLWPRGSCAQECLADAISATPLPEVAKPSLASRVFPIHFPAWLAASLAFWFIGLFWYSDRYLFRDWWMSQMGYDETLVRRVAELWGPHLITVGIALVCTFGIAMALELFGRHTVTSGLAAGFLFWLVIWAAMVVVILMAGRPHELIWIHGGYTLIASLAAGAILGAWTPGRVVRWLDRE